MTLPPLPPWNAAHVLLIHFPIALLIITPLMLLIAIIFRSSARQFAIAAGVVLICGTLGAQLAVMTGEAAEDLARKEGALDDPEIKEALEDHSDDGELVRNVYAVMSLLYLIYLVLPAVRSGRISSGANTGILLLFLLASGAGALLVANTAHLGGVLVHVHNITAPIDGANAEEAADGGNDGSDTHVDVD